MNEKETRIGDIITNFASDMTLNGTYAAVHVTEDTKSLVGWFGRPGEVGLVVALLPHKSSKKSFALVVDPDKVGWNVLL